MPRSPQHEISWSPIDNRYDFHAPGRVARHFQPGDEESWQGWLATVASFAFRGVSGSLNVYREARPRGGGYWYAYRTAAGRTRKRYLGTTARVSLARLEEVAAALAAAPGAATPVPAAPVADTATVLPATKLAPPQPPIAPVARGRLLAALDAALGTPLTLVSAPAGWGKTTLLAAWARRHPRRVAWLALDAADDTPARFWAAAIAALRTRAPGVGATALALLRAPQPPPPAVVVTALLNELAGPGAGAAPLVLLLDDYQVIADGAVHASVAFLLDHLPAGLRLVIAGRADPDLPLARLRARGQLAELRAADLRFTAAETGAFLGGALDAPLADAEVAALAARTEGWAAGVQLAALALRGRADPAAWLAGFTGGHRFLLDYVEEEILARQPPATRRFLLQVAVLPRLGADLCAAVAGEPASRDILDALERANLFVVPLDEERRWYRLHDLFREALLARAAREPGLLAGAHARAARWHAEHGDGREAIGHALAAEDYELAADLIAREAPRLWLAGEARAVHDWLLLLPDVVLWRHARLALDAARRLVESLHSAAAATHAEARLGVERLLGRVEAGLGVAAAAPDGAEAALIGRRIRLLRALLDARAYLVRADAPGLARLVEEVAGLAEGEEIGWATIRSDLRFWLAFSMRHEGARLIPELLALKARALRAGEGQAALTTTVRLAQVYMAEGRLDLVERTCLEGLALAARAGIQTSSAGYLHLCLTAAHYDRNRPEEAAVSLRAAFPIARTWRQIDQLLLALCYRIYLGLLRGDPAGAGAALREAGAIVRREGSAYHAPWVAEARVRYWLATGDLAAADRWAARTAFDAATWTPVQNLAFLARVRVALARGRHAAALAALDRFAALLDRPGDVPTVVECLALRLVALHQAGAIGQARAAAARLLALTESAGWLRVYLDGGPPMEAALAALLDASADGPADDPPLPRAAIARLLAAFDDERRAGRAGDPAATPAPGTAAVPRAAGLIEPLTRREREVLAHLADGATNQEIAAALSLSVNTVKRHVGGLLGKLGATGRTGAVARARAAGLL